MRRTIELVLLLSGAFALAWGLDWARTGVPQIWQWVPFAAGGLVALILGILLTLRRELKASRAELKQPAALPGAPMGAVVLAFDAYGPPRILGADPGLAVTLDNDGIVSLKINGRSSRGKLICRTSGTPAYFNTLRQDEHETAIKLVSPVPAVVRLEVWDGASLVPNR